MNEIKTKDNDDDNDDDEEEEENTSYKTHLLNWILSILSCFRDGFNSICHFKFPTIRNERFSFKMH